VIAADKLWIMVDVETSGPIIGRHSMTELGAVVGSQARGVIDRFEVLIAPISDLQKTSRASFERAKISGLPPTEAMARFAAWCKPHLERRASFIARPAAFDWPWIVQYAWAHLGENPFGFKAVCASSWLEAQGRTFQVDLPHRAVDDAEIQLKHFFERG
jgi:ribonuclease T